MIRQKWWRSNILAALNASGTEHNRMDETEGLFVMLQDLSAEFYLLLTVFKLWIKKTNKLQVPSEQHLLRQWQHQGGTRERGEDWLAGWARPLKDKKGWQFPLLAPISCCFSFLLFPFPNKAMKLWLKVTHLLLKTDIVIGVSHLPVS